MGVLLGAPPRGREACAQQGRRLRRIHRKPDNNFRLQAFLSTWQQRSCEQVPRAGGQLPDGLLMKMMAIVGSGGKALKFYVFGPECQCQCDRFRPRLFQKL